jgi:hypothetical protein
MKASAMSAGMHSAAAATKIMPSWKYAPTNPMIAAVAAWPPAAKR